MSFDSEWAEAKAVSMRLNQAPAMDPGGPGPQPGSADYIIHDDELGDIGHAAFGLFNGLESGGKHARTASQTAGTALKGDGFETGSALSEVSDTWDTQVKTLLQACAHISNHLDHTKKSRKEDDDWIETQLRIIGPVAPGADASVSASQISKFFS
ncbi:hypothetical protein [Streptomyces sp. PR69]|uniref:hypothetical protein n=1 Tax=Streptomyces sp. PR69 TaxID=2984950 RepID=UPI0022644E2F|nr:hypothetical protein [Streptomyces sp. PR69]